MKWWVPPNPIYWLFLSSFRVAYFSTYSPCLCQFVSLWVSLFGSSFFEFMWFNESVAVTYCSCFFVNGESKQWAMCGGYITSYCMFYSLAHLFCRMDRYRGNCRLVQNYAYVNFRWKKVMLWVQLIWEVFRKSLICA